MFMFAKKTIAVKELVRKKVEEPKKKKRMSLHWNDNRRLQKKREGIFH